MLRHTVFKYPDSHIAKVLSANPHLGSAEQLRLPVRIDHHPQTFKWILEIYR